MKASLRHVDYTVTETALRNPGSLQGCIGQNDNQEMERLNYREIVEKFAEIDQWLREMGLNQYDRIRTHKRNITELAEAQDSGRLEQIARSLAGEKRREILWSFVESIEFVDAIDALRKSGSDVPKHLLEKALQGPPDAYLEDNKSNQGRNAMFEIAVAGRAAFAGLRPRLGGEPDVFFEFEKRRIFVQCKRVLSATGVAKRIGEAAKQLKRDLATSSDPRDCGLIAISISRLVNPGDKMLAVAAEPDLRRVMNNEIDKVIGRHDRIFRELREPKTAGIIFQMATPAFVEEYGLFTVAQSATIYPIPGKSDVGLLKAIARLIKI